MVAKLKKGDRVVYSYRFSRYPERAVWSTRYIPARYDGKVGAIVNNPSGMDTIRTTHMMPTAVVQFKDGKKFEIPLPLLRKMPKVPKGEISRYSNIEMLPSGSVWGKSKATGKRVRIRRIRKR